MNVPCSVQSSFCPFSCALRWLPFVLLLMLVLGADTVNNKRA